MTALRARWRRAVVLTALALASIAAAGCGGSSGRGSAQSHAGCLEGWNGVDNSQNRQHVAGAYAYAKVVAAATGTRDACLFAFHGDDPPVLLLAGRWRGDQLVVSHYAGGRNVAAPLPGGTPPSGEDNAIVSGTGRLLSGGFPPETRVEAPAQTPRWLLLRARRDATLYHDPSPTAVVIRPDGKLWRVTLRGRFICESCFVPVGQPKPKAVVVEEFNSHTKAGQGISYG